MTQKQMTVRSKKYVLPGPHKRFFVRFLNLCVLGLIIASVISFVMSGFQVGILLGLAVPAAIVSSFSKREAVRAHYEFCIVEIRFEEDALQLDYGVEHSGKEAEVIRIPYVELISVEYGRQLSCVRLNFAQQISHSSNGAYHLLYMENTAIEEFGVYLKQQTGISMLERQ